MTDILIISRDPDLAGFLRHIFQLAGRSISITQNRECVLQDLQTARPGLIIMDMIGADWNGLELLEAIRARSSTPIMVLGSQGDQESCAAALAMGADDYLGVPFRPVELKAGALDLICRWRDREQILDRRLEAPVPDKI